jgi:hypothetical protein
MSERKMTGEVVSMGTLFVRACAFAALVIAVPAHAQNQNQQGPMLGSGEDPRPMRPLDPLEPPELVNATEDGGNLSANARKALARYGVCVADRSREKAAKTVAMNFRSTDYRLSLKLLSEHNHDCFARGRMRFSNMLFAGALAERLLAVGDTRLNARLARAAGSAAIEPFGPADRIAICTVRSDPDNVAALFAAEAASPAEKSALSALRFVAGRCSAGAQVEISDAGLRAILATAAFRVVQAGS